MPGTPPECHFFRPLKFDRSRFWRTSVCRFWHSAELREKTYRLGGWCPHDCPCPTPARLLNQSLNLFNAESRFPPSSSLFGSHNCSPTCLRQQSSPKGLLMVRIDFEVHIAQDANRQGIALLSVEQFLSLSNGLARVSSCPGSPGFGTVGLCQNQSRRRTHEKCQNG